MAGAVCQGFGDVGLKGGCQEGVLMLRWVIGNPWSIALSAGKLWNAELTQEGHPL